MPTSPSTPTDSLQSLSDAIAGAVDAAAPAVVAIHARRRIPASGIHLRDGIVAAASHTIRREEEITVLLGDGRTVPATLLGRDPTTDLAALRLEGAAPPDAPVGDAARLRVGQLVVAVGRPGEDGATASLGAVSALGPAWRTWQGGRVDRFIRLDLAIYDGFSGGPLVDAGGRVVGLNSSALARGAAVALPISTVTRVVEQLAERGHVARGWLGVAMQPVRLPDSLVRAQSLPGGTGLLVLGVEPGGPADRGGLLLGDIVVALGGEPVEDTGDVAAMLGGDRIGATLATRIVRGGQSRELALTVGERPRGER
jgi:S1-C subfamily serine protease